MDRLRNVLQSLLTAILDAEGELSTRVIQDGLRDADAARLGEPLKPSRDGDPIAVDGVAVDDDVAEVDADTELDAVVHRYIGVALCHAALDIDRASHRIDDTSKFDEHAVASGLDDAAVVLR